MRFFRLLICAGYWGLLTVLLLAPHPATLLGFRRLPTFPWGDVGTHLIAFTVLTLVVLGSQWPRWPAWRLLLALVAYGLAAETLQWFVPPRAVELLDYAENLLGVGVGMGMYCLARRALRPFRAPPAPRPARPAPVAVAPATTGVIPRTPAPIVVRRRSHVGDATGSTAATSQTRRDC